MPEINDFLAEINATGLVRTNKGLTLEFLPSKKITDYFKLIFKQFLLNYTDRVVKSFSARKFPDTFRISCVTDELAMAYVNFKRWYDKKIEAIASNLVTGNCSSTSPTTPVISISSKRAASSEIPKTKLQKGNFTKADELENDDA
ncbi:hypothetical protein GJ496_003022 [Pomphorhynchus laevis]|nr:hypothetical protein GJ496_003022 [Pomphorhynchus laevis]